MAGPLDSDRGAARAALDRFTDGGVARDIGEPGVADSEAMRLTALWWAGTAAEIFRRAPNAAGAGGGSTLEQDQGLARQLMTCFGELATDSKLLGIAFGVPSGNKSELREAVAATLSRLVAPVLAGVSARTPSRPSEVAIDQDQTVMRNSNPAGVPEALVKKKKKPIGFYTQESRYIHDRRLSDAVRLNGVTKHRRTTYDAFIEYAGKEHAREFAARADIQEAVWKKRYEQAVTIAARARGELEIEDDYFSLPNRDDFGGLPSDKLIGDVVHEVLQKRYLGLPQVTKHNVVSEEGRRVTYFKSTIASERRTATPFWDLVTSAGPDAINSLAFSLGSESWHLRPDIVDLDAKMMFEIKPIRSVHKGTLQMWRYISNFRLGWTMDDILNRPEDTKRWLIYELVPGFPPLAFLKPFELYPYLRKRRVGQEYDKYKKAWVEPMMFSSLPGLVAYRLRNGDPDKDRDRVPKFIEALIKLAMVAAVAAIVAFLVVTLIPVVLPAVVAAVAFLAAVLSGVINILPPVRAPLPLPLEVANVLNAALKNDSAQISTDALSFIFNKDTRFAL